MCIGEVEMDSKQSDDVLKMGSLVNNSSERCFQTYQIWEELFPESKTMLISDLKDLIDKIGEVSYYKDLHFTLIGNCSKIAV